MDVRKARKVQPMRGSVDVNNSTTNRSKDVSLAELVKSSGHTPSAESRSPSGNRGLGLKHSTGDIDVFGREKEKKRFFSPRDY